MPNRGIIFLYALLLSSHAAHVGEEVWGQFWMIDALYGLALFVFLNFLGFCVPAFFFYHVLSDRRWAYQLSIIYCGFMALQGIGHNVATLVTGRYFGGFAGGFTGIALAILGVALVLELRKAMPQRAEVYRTKPSGESAAIPLSNYRQGE